MVMLAASVVATVERCRRLQRRYFYAEVGAVVGTVILGAAAIVAVVFENQGAPLPIAAVAVISALLGACVLGALLMLSTPAVLRAVIARVDIVRVGQTRAEESLRAATELQAQILTAQREMLVELGRLRMSERDQLCTLRMIERGVARRQPAPSSLVGPVGLDPKVIDSARTIARQLLDGQ